MKNLWTKEEAENYNNDLELRVFTSNLLGRSDELVLHGGGNTSVKLNVDGEEILYVKGSGWDLVSIQKEGFAPVKLEVLKEMAKLDSLSDTDMVSQQKAAMIDKTAPNPSVEAILHAIIPYKFVDHTHADAVVTISNCENGIENIKKVFPNFLIIPYVMPGFILARTIYEMTKDFDWDSCEGIILHNHGIFTFDDDGKKSYDKMIDAVSKAEDFLNENVKLNIDENLQSIDYDLDLLKDIISKEKECELFFNINQSKEALYYASQESLKQGVTKGVLTPEHIIRTKRVPLVLEDKNILKAVEDYMTDYKNYFKKYAKDVICLNAAPNYAVIKNYGLVSFGKSQKEADVINDVVSHTISAVLKADTLGGYKSISEKDSFEMEYWELEQAKLKK